MKLSWFLIQVKAIAIWRKFITIPLYDLKWKIKIWYQQTFHPTEQEIWEKKMAKEFPKLYKKRANGSPFKCDGFAIGKGWRVLVVKLSYEITKYCNEEDVKFPTVLQVKEKWGGLCYYIGGGDEHINKLIAEAEKLSFIICEYCGSIRDVKQTKKDWIKTLCCRCRGEEPKYRDMEMMPSISPDLIEQTLKELMKEKK